MDEYNIKSDLDCESTTRQRLIAKDFSSDNKASEINDDLYQLIFELNNNISTLSDEYLYGYLTKISEIVNRMTEIPDYFIQDLNIVLLFSQILQATKNHEIFEISLIILQGLIYLSPSALDIFINIDLTDLLISTLMENSAIFDSEDYIVSTILGIMQAMLESQNFHLEHKILPQLFIFVEICKNRINENTEVVENLKICLGIFGSFIRFNDKEAINQYLNQFLEIIIFLPNPTYQEVSIPIVCDLAEKGFVDEIINSGLYQTCFNLLCNKSFKKSYEFIIKLIIQIIEQNSESFELTHEYLNQFIPFERIYQLLKFYKDKEIQESCLTLYEKISSIGGLKILLDQEAGGQNNELLINYLNNGCYSNKSKVYRILWDGLLKLNDCVDQIFIMNSPIFISMTSFVDFLDDFDLLYSIFSFFQQIFSITAVSSINQLDENTINCIISFADECLKCDNEEFVRFVKDFLDRYF